MAELLVAYREQAGLKQSEFAEKLGRHQPFVSNLEAGQRRVDLIELRIPMQAGRVFRSEAGQRSDLMSATIPI